MLGRYWKLRAVQESALFFPPLLKMTFELSKAEMGQVQILVRLIGIVLFEEIRSSEPFEELDVRRRLLGKRWERE